MKKSELTRLVREAVAAELNQMPESITRDIQNAHGASRDALIKKQAAIQKGYHPDFPAEFPKHPEHKSAIAKAKLNRNMAETEKEAFGADYKTEPYNYTRSGPRDKAKTEAITSPEGKAARKAEKDLRTAARGQSTRSDTAYKGKGIDRFDKARKHWKNWDKLGDRSVAAGKKADSEESRTGRARWKANMAEQARQSVKNYINKLDENDMFERISKKLLKS